MRSAFILGLVALAGCASSPAYRSPALHLPVSFREASDTSGSTPHAVTPNAIARESTDQAPPPRSDYWEQLGDTTLNRLIAEVVRANQDIQAAEARVRATRSERVRTLLDLTPDTRLTGSYARQRLSSSTFPGFAGAFPDQNVWDAGVSASWDLDVFGQIRQTAQARGAMVGAAQEELRDVKVSLTAELALTYFELRGAQEQLSVALASIPTREAQVAAAQYRIGVLVGRPPAAVAAELDKPGQLPALPDVASIGNPEAVVRGRPDVAAAERQAAAQGALVGAAKASYLPRISIGGSAGYVAPELRTVGAGGTLRYAVGPVISWPLLSLGRVKADVDAAQAGEDEARAHYRAVVLSAMQDVEVSIIQYRAARVRVERLEEASAASEHAAKLALLRYTEGATDLLQVLDAQRTQLEAQDRLAQARIDAGTAYAALFKAVGGR